jgi:SRSO17 transposase
VIDRAAIACVHRLMAWLEAFKPCFGHRAQQVSLRRYVQGLLSDSARKSMQAMLERVTQPGSYQAFQHFITHAPWNAAVVWRQLRARVPARHGVLILDSTSFPKQGEQSVGVARQYCGALGKVANCQVAVTAALWTGVRAWLLGAQLYLPEEWVTTARRTLARIPAHVRFQEKWRLGVQLIRQVRAAGFDLTAVIADAEFGDTSTFRAFLHQAHFSYAVGISSHLTVFPGTPVVVGPSATQSHGRPRTRLRLARAHRPRSVAAVAATLPARVWRRLTYRRTPARRWAATFAAVRVTPAHAWRHGQLAPEVWLLCERRGHQTIEHKYYFVHLPPTASLRALVQLAHQRWAVEQQYQELKTELGLDHFEGRTWPGWEHHVVLTAVAYAFLQDERRRARQPLSFPAVRAIVQEVFTLYLFAQRPHYLKVLDELRSVDLRI